jgi:hypothetical protein
MAAAAVGQGDNSPYRIYRKDSDGTVLQCRLTDFPEWVVPPVGKHIYLTEPFSSCAVMEAHLASIASRFGDPTAVTMIGGISCLDEARDVYDHLYTGAIVRFKPWDLLMHAIIM